MAQTDAQRAITTMIVPPPVPERGVIGVVAPGFPPHVEALEQGIQVLKEMGFHVIEGEHLRDRRGHLAGADEARAADLMHMFEDRDIDGIVCARGGGGAIRILPYLDFDLIRKHSKRFVGYSDITVLHLALWHEARLMTFYGPMVATELATPQDEYAQRSFSHALIEPMPTGPIRYDAETFRPKTIVPGRSTGRLIGGTLCLVVSMHGTPFQLDARGKILFLEDYNEPPFRIERYLMQLKLAGTLDAATGFLIGTMPEALEDDGSEEALPVEQIVEEILKPLGKPTLIRFPCGHMQNTVTLPLGARVTLDADAQSVDIVGGT